MTSLAGVQVALRYVLFDTAVNSPGQYVNHALNAAIRYLERSGVADALQGRKPQSVPGLSELFEDGCVRRPRLYYQG